MTSKSIVYKFKAIEGSSFSVSKPESLGTDRNVLIDLQGLVNVRCPFQSAVFQDKGTSEKQATNLSDLGLSLEEIQNMSNLTNLRRMNDMKSDK